MKTDVNGTVLMERARRISHRADCLAEAAQRQHEKDAADRDQGEKLRPDDAETGPR